MALQDSYFVGSVTPVAGFSPALMPYADASYDYTCVANPGTGLTESKWKVFRTDKTSGRIMHANGGLFTCVATSVTVVAALTYT